tara:strand:+ start:213 stop:440 length:228 start_codon:yes stop_codon:yes gene_type:complete
MNTDINKNKKENRDSDLAFTLAKSFNDVSTTASIYAKISVLRDLIVHIQGEIVKLEELGQKNDPLSGLKGSDKGG